MGGNICVCEKMGVYRLIIYYRDMLYYYMFYTFMISRIFKVLHNIKLEF